VSARRVLVATDGDRLPATALMHADDLAGAGGVLVLESVLVVPHAQPLEASLERSVASACEMLEAAERTMADAAAPFDTRLVRARSFAEGVLETLAKERFDLVLVEKGRAPAPDGAAGQIQALFEKAPTVVMLVRPDKAARG
jgi:hypothetical protein